MQRLRRGLGFWSAVAMAIGGMIGAGVFVLLGIGAGMVGPALPIAFVIAGALAFFNATSSAELGARYPLSGGTYEYANRLISRDVGFLAGFIFTASKLLEGATVALAFGAYLAVFVNFVDPRIVAIVAIAVFTVVNHFGIKNSGSANNIFVAIKVAILAILIIFATRYVSAPNFSGIAQVNAGSLLSATALLFFSYTGFARIATLGEEIKNPKRTIPMATFTALAITALVYVLVSVVAIGTIGSKALAGSSSPLAAVAGAISPSMVVLVTFGALVATASVLLGDLLAASRIIFAMGRRHDLPYTFGEVHKRYRIPYNAQIAASAIMMAVAAIGNLAFAAFLTSLTILIYYALTNLSALRLKKRDLLFPRFVAVSGFLGCAALSLFIPPIEWAVTLAMVLVGLAYYKLWVKK